MTNEEYSKLGPDAKRKAFQDASEYLHVHAPYAILELVEKLKGAIKEGVTTAKAVVSPDPVVEEVAPVEAPEAPVTEAVVPEAPAEVVAEVAETIAPADEAPAEAPVKEAKAKAPAKKAAAKDK